MDSPEKEKILTIVALLGGIDWIGFNSPEDTFAKNNPYQYGLIEILCDTVELIKLCSAIPHCEESKLFNHIVHIRYTPNQSVVFIRFGYLNKALRLLESMFSGFTTPYETSRDINTIDSEQDSDDLSFLKGSKVKSMHEKDDHIEGVLKFKEPDLRMLWNENIDEFIECNLTCKYRIGCSYDVLMFVPNINQLVSVWLKKDNKQT